MHDELGGFRICGLGFEPVAVLGKVLVFVYTSHRMFPNSKPSTLNPKELLEIMSSL